MPLLYRSFMGGERGPRPVVASATRGWTPLRKPLAESRVALLSSSATRLETQAPFAPPSDWSFRAFPIDAPADALRLDHTSGVGTDARVDQEIVLPRTALRALADEGLVGSVAPRCLTFVGGLGPDFHQRVENELSPQIAGELLADGVDLAVLVPF